MFKKALFLLLLAAPALQQCGGGIPCPDLYPGAVNYAIPGAGFGGGYSQNVILNTYTPQAPPMPQKRYVLLPADLEENTSSRFVDWNYLYPGTRTRDIQNRYPVDNGQYNYQASERLKNVTALNSNTWVHKNNWYERDLSNVVIPWEGSQEEVYEVPRGYMYGGQFHPLEVMSRDEKQELENRARNSIAQYCQKQKKWTMCN